MRPSLAYSPEGDQSAAPLCELTHVHGDTVHLIHKRMPNNVVLQDLADLYKIFGDPTRIRILHVLLESEVCVCDLAALLGMSQSAISHQLRILKNSRLVKFRREGKTVFYSLADGHISTILDQGLEHVQE